MLLAQKEKERFWGGSATFSVLATKSRRVQALERTLTCKSMGAKPTTPPLTPWPQRDFLAGSIRGWERLWSTLGILGCRMKLSRKSDMQGIMYKDVYKQRCLRNRSHRTLAVEDSESLFWGFYLASNEGDGEPFIRPLTLLPLTKS